MKIKIFNQKFDIVVIWKLRKTILRCIFNNKKIINFFRAEISRMMRKKDLKSLPIALNIEPTTRCNLKCPMCWRTYIKPVRDIDLTFENYKKIIDQVANTLLFLFLWNWGEPLLHKDIAQMVEYAKNKGIFVSLSTNAFFLDEKAINEMISSGLDHMIISLDAATKETYLQCRPGSDFNKVTNNIKNLIAKKRQKKSILPFINLQFIVMKMNETELIQAKNLGKELGVDKVSFKKLDAPIKHLREKLSPVNKKFKPDVYGKKTRNLKCFRPWFHCVINSDGDVIPCCHDFTFKYVLGNVFKESFGKIWHNKEYTGFRRQILEGKVIEMCKFCPGLNFGDSFLTV